MVLCLQSSYSEILHNDIYDKIMTFRSTCFFKIYLLHYDFQTTSGMFFDLFSTLYIVLKKQLHSLQFFICLIMNIFKNKTLAQKLSVNDLIKKITDHFFINFNYYSSNQIAVRFCSIDYNYYESEKIKYIVFVSS